MKALQLLLISVVIIVGCKKQVNNVLKPDTLKTVVTPPDAGIYHYLALGDSYTIGTSVQPDQSYPIQLISAMNAAGLSTPNPTIVAADGWTTDVLIHAIASNNIANNKYQVVTLLIGVNDQYEGLTQSHYRTNFIQLLHTAMNFAGGDSTRVFVCRYQIMG